MVKNISKDAGLSHQYTNHCLKASTATILKRAGVESQDIMCVTGHKNVASLNSYAQGPSNAQRANMSNILGQYGKKNSCTASATVSKPTDDTMSVVPYVPVPSTSDTNMSIEATQNTDALAVTTSEAVPTGSVQVVTTTNNSVVDNTAALFHGAVFNGPVTINVQLNK